MRDSRQSEFPAADSPLHERRGDKRRSLRASWWARACAAVVICAAAAIASPAQTFTTLLSFDNTDGAEPLSTLIQATDGNLYGTTYGGGAQDTGTVFKIAPSGALTTLYSFCSRGGRQCLDGDEPTAPLVQGVDGSFFGTTPNGGVNGRGTVFEINSSGAEAVLYSFCARSACTDGVSPYGGLVQATDGNLYGTTDSGGAHLRGTVFRITSRGKLTTLYSFCSLRGCVDGLNPVAGLVQGTDGDFYGTTYLGGANSCPFAEGNHGCGTLFKITPSGTLTTLYSFCSQSDCADGAIPTGALIQATDGNLYGTTYEGGETSSACNGCGTVFKITHGGVLTTLYRFCSQSGCADGALPEAGLVQASDGNFLGTTFYGGTGTVCNNGCGTVYEITPSATLTTLHSFNSTDGSYPEAGLVQDTNGILYGTTFEGGANGEGTIFSLSLGLGPFVETQPTSAKVGKPINILGTSLTGATSVTFNGTPATFTVLSPSLIRTTVPAGATTGPVQVVTPGGTLSSNVPFRVIP